MEGLGEKFLATGWAEEHVGAAGEKVKSWLVMRGWEGMKWFEKAIKTEEFGEGVGILMGWGAKYDLVSDV